MINTYFLDNAYAYKLSLLFPGVISTLWLGLFLTYSKYSTECKILCTATRLVVSGHSAHILMQKRANYLDEVGDIYSPFSDKGVCKAVY